MIAAEARYRYQPGYVPDFAAFQAQVRAKTVVPHQVELQPGPAGGKICWLECPFCCGGAAKNTDERLPTERWVEILDEIASRGVQKVIFSGYATDPLRSPAIADLLHAAMRRGMVFGFNTRALAIPKLFGSCLSFRKLENGSYISISVDAGSNETYSAVHGAQPGLQLYDRVVQNTARFAAARAVTGKHFDLSATYLVSRLNADDGELRGFAADFRRAGADLLRFTFAQLPRGARVGELATVPGKEECALYAKRLKSLAAELDTAECRVLFVDADQEHGIFGRPRTLPCVARWVFPTVGFDGWLYPCSQSAAPNFRGMALGNLAERDFWDCYYDYDPEKLDGVLAVNAALVDHLDCRCDRKAHLVNAEAAARGAFS